MRVPFLFEFEIDDDELYSLRNSENMFAEPTPSAVRAWPVTFAAARLFTELFGLDVFALRLLPVLCGLLTPLVLRRVGTELVGVRAATAAAWVCAFWPWHQYYSGLSRYYAPLFLVSILILGRVHRALRGGGGLHDWVATFLLLILAGATHSTGILAAAGAAVLAARSGVTGIDRRGRLWLVGGILALGGAVLLVPPLSAPVLNVMSGAGGHGYDAFQFLLGLAFNVTPLLILLAAIGAFVQNVESRPRAPFLLASAIAPVVLLCVLTLFSVEAQARYAMAGMPSVLLLCGVGVERMTVAIDRGAGVARAAVLVAVLAPLAPGVVSNLRDGDRHDFAAASEHVERELQAGQSLYSESHTLLGYFLWGLDRWLLEGTGEPPFPLVFEELPPTKAQLDTLRRVRPEAWFVIPDNKFQALPATGHAEFQTWLRENGAVDARFGVRRLDYHWNLLTVYRTGARR